MEEAYGTIRIAIIYFLSGIGGFLFGASFNDLTRTSCLGSDSFLNVTFVQRRWVPLDRFTAFWHVCYWT